MARYIKTIPTNLSFEEFNSIVSGYLTSEGFKQKTLKNENVWQKGAGWLTAPQYVTAVYNGNSITLTAFIKYAIIPGVWYCGESDLSGFVGCVPKQALEAKVTTLERNLQQTAYNKQIYMQQQTQVQYAQPQQWQNNMQNF
ncbi:MAG: hypothetical protein IJO29_01905 [Oscillospiraceae bacterium]|nr:hypothetical protein [Oscillospiraceae bacterium]